MEDYITFGSYEQDGNEGNGKEPIEWVVLAKENNRLLVTSRYALDNKPYDYRVADTTWENCSLRKWLNSIFLNTAFNSEEQEKIPTVTVTADKSSEYSADPGNDTQDKVFLLSVTDLNNYFFEKAWECKTTAYSRKQGAAYDLEGYQCSWWLRTTGEMQDLAMVFSYGACYDYEVFASDVAVRPAMWICLEP